MKKNLLILLLAAATLTAAEPSPKELDALTKTGDEAATKLISTLSGNLKKKMQEGGPMAAFTYCSNFAYTLTESINKELPNGVTVKRVSIRNRNPLNQAEVDEKQVLRGLHLLKSSGAILPEYILQPTDHGTYKYYKPLLVNKELCMTCHGDLSTNPELAAAIKRNYPTDLAKDFEPGDLRGAVVVEIKP